MLTLLSTVKARLAIEASDATFDALLTSAIAGVSARFDRESGRTLAHTENFVQEFSADETELCAACYPIECVAKFETKLSEAEGWLEQSNVDYLIRRGCIISLRVPLAFSDQPSAFPQARITYAGGYVLPGASPVEGQARLPADLEQAAIEQVAFWFQNRDKLGVVRYWPKGGIYEQFADLDLLPSVRAVLEGYRRWNL